MSVLVRRLYSTKVLNSVCHKNFGVRGKFVRQPISWLWLKVTSAADNLLIFYFACAKFVTRFASNWKSSRLSSICASLAGVKLANNSPAPAFFLFFCFSLSGSKYFRTLVANIGSTNFLGSSFFWKVYAPNCVISKVLCALRGASLTKRSSFFLLIIVAIHSC